MSFRENTAGVSVDFNRSRDSSRSWKSDVGFQNQAEKSI